MNVQTSCSIIDPRDAEYINSMPNPVERDLATRAVSTYRRPERLQADDAIPQCDLYDLRDQCFKPLSARNGRPLVLFFGSYT